MRRLLILGCLAVSGVAAAQTWNEVGDAGNLVATAQVTLGVGNLATINGTHTANDVDLYCVDLTSPGTFSATTVGITTWDTQLWLFAGNGNGIAFNDDAPGAGVLQSRLTSLFTANMAPGTDVYLGISRYNNDALNPAGSLIWANTPFDVERAPDGPGAPGPLASWNGSTLAGGAYSIALTGAGYCAVPEPGTMAVLGIGALAAFARRRRK